MKEGKGFISLDGMWRKTDLGEPNGRFVDQPEYLQQMASYKACMSVLLSHAGVNQALIKPAVVEAVEIGNSQRALFGLEVNMGNRREKNMAEIELEKLKKFIVQERELAKHDFENYQFDAQSMWDSVNFVDYLLAVRLL